MIDYFAFKSVKATVDKEEKSAELTHGWKRSKLCLSMGSQMDKGLQNLFVIFLESSAYQL